MLQKSIKIEPTKVHPTQRKTLKIDLKVLFFVFRLVREYKTENSIDTKEKSDRNMRRKMLPENKRESLKNENDDKFLGEKK